MDFIGEGIQSCTCHEAFCAAYALDPTYVPARYNMEQYAQMYPTGKCAFTEEDKMSRPNVQKILYKNVQLVWLS